MGNLKQKKLLVFKDEVKHSILQNVSLLVKLSNLTNSDVHGVSRMLKNDSQTLMHIAIMKHIGTSLKLDINYLTNTPKPSAK